MESLLRLSLLRSLRAWRVQNRYVSQGHGGMREDRTLNMHSLIRRVEIRSTDRTGPGAKSTAYTVQLNSGTLSFDTKCLSIRYTKYLSI